LENLKESDHLRDLSVDKRIILKWKLSRRLGGPRSGSGGENKKSHHCPCRELNPGSYFREIGCRKRIEVAQGNVQWWAIVITVMNL
jgi:hypothetical protein